MNRNLHILFHLLVFSLMIYAIEPTMINNGLAVYKIGEGEPVFVMPYPHGGTSVSISEDSITKNILKIGKSVVTFDPPGAYNSTCDAAVDMDEMLDCVNKVLSTFNIQEPIDMVGHSMGSLCALAYSINYPEKVKRLVLIGCTSGWNQQKKYGVHKSWKWWRDKEYWQSRYWGTKIYMGLDNLETYNKLNNIVFEASFVDKKYFHPFPIHRGDNKKPIPIRGRWLENVRNYDYHNQLPRVEIPVMICAGKHDVQTPLIMNQQLHAGIRNSSIEIFENSGHFPFIEEKEKFLELIDNFLN